MPLDALPPNPNSHTFPDLGRAVEVRMAEKSANKNHDAFSNFLVNGLVAGTSGAVNPAVNPNGSTKPEVSPKKNPVMGLSPHSPALAAGAGTDKHARGNLLPMKSGFPIQALPQNGSALGHFPILPSSISPSMSSSAGGALGSPSVNQMLARIAKPGQGKLAIDGNSLSELKALSRRDSKASVTGAAKQMEGLFIGMMMKSMRQSTGVFKSDLLESQSEGTYRDMLDAQVSSELANRGMGLSTSFEKSLKKSNSVSPQDVPLTSEVASQLMPKPSFAQSLGVTNLLGKEIEEANICPACTDLSKTNAIKSLTLRSDYYAEKPDYTFDSIKLDELIKTGFYGINANPFYKSDSHSSLVENDQEDEFFDDGVLSGLVGTMTRINEPTKKEFNSAAPIASNDIVPQEIATREPADELDSVVHNLMSKTQDAQTLKMQALVSGDSVDQIKNQTTYQPKESVPGVVKDPGDETGLREQRSVNNNESFFMNP